MRAQLRCFITEDLFSPDWSTDYHKTISLSLDKSEAKQSFIIILNMEVEEGSQTCQENQVVVTEGSRTEQQVPPCSVREGGVRGTEKLVVLTD